MRQIKKTQTKKILSIIFIVVIFGFQATSINFANGMDCNIAADKKECEALQKKAAAYQEIINIKKKTQATLQNQLNLIDLQQSKNKAELEKTKEKAKNIEQKIAELNRNIKDKEVLLQYQQQILLGLIQSYYEYNQDGLLNIVLLNQDFSDIFSQTDRIAQSSDKVGDVLQTIRHAKAELQNDHNNLQTKKQESEEVKSELEDKNLKLQNSEDQKEVLLGKTKAETEKYQKLLSDIEDEISNLEANISASTDLSNLPPDKSGYFTYPVNPHIITQGYGRTSFARKSGFYKNNFHNGFDFGIKYSSVFAAKNGKVVGSGDNGKYAYGKWIAVDHGDGLVTMYGHLSSKAVSKGDSVKEGQKIGVSGNTGNSTGPHLHFTIFASKSFKVVESSYVSGLMIPTGASVTPKKYL